MKQCGLILLTLALAAGLLPAQPVVVTPEGSQVMTTQWGANVQVTGVSIYDFDVDYRANGEMYLGYIYPYAGRDSIKILKSSDGGLSWTLFKFFLANEHRKVTALSLVCGDTALTAFIAQDTAQGGMREYQGRFGYGGSTGWSYFSDTLNGPRGIIVEVDADRNADGDTILLAYVADSAGTSTGMAVLQSINGGANWQWAVSNKYNRYVNVSWIKGQRWAVACKSYSPSNTYRKHTMVYLSNDGGVNFRNVRVDSTGRDTTNIEPSITACRSTGRTFIAVTRVYSPTDHDINAYQARDEGDTTYAMAYGYSPSGYQDMPAVNSLRFGESGWLDLVFQDDNGDSIRSSTSQYGGSGAWGVEQVISDRPSSRLVGPKIAYCPDGSHPGPAVFYAGLGENGIYMNAGWVTGVAGNPENGISSAVLRMEPARPNPFRQTTTIKYQTAQSGTVNLSVYNIAGQLVRTLVDGWRPAGAHAVKWDGRDGTGRGDIHGRVFLPA